MAQGLWGVGGITGGLAQGPLVCLAVGHCAELLLSWTFSCTALGISMLPSSSWCCCLVMPGGAATLPPSSGSLGHVSQGPELSGKRKRALGLIGPLCQAVGISELAESTEPCQRQRELPSLKLPVSHLGDSDTSRSTCKQLVCIPRARGCLVSQKMEKEKSVLALLP